MPAHPLQALGLYGLDHLQSVWLAALIDEQPLLLIGPPGCAKSLLIERTAAALGLRHRHYNASLVNFDDVTGFAIPNADRTGLVHLHAQDSIWDAQSVFIDELSRCRPEMANKFFGIIHERKIFGRSLTALKYRWSAMNPPADPERDNDAWACIGAQPLDLALADRFARVVPLPALGDMDYAVRFEMLVRAGAAEPTADEWTQCGLPELVAAGQAQLHSVSPAQRATIAAWANALVAPLQAAGWPVTGRRAMMLCTAAAATWAATRTLTGSDDWSEALMTTLLYGLPQRASGSTLDYAKLVAIHRAAWADSNAPLTGVRRRLRELSDPVARVAVALQATQAEVDRSLMGTLVADAYAGLPPEHHLLFCRNVLAALREDRLPSHVYELLFAPMEKLRAFVAAGEQAVHLPRGLSTHWSRALGQISVLKRRGNASSIELANILYLVIGVDQLAADAEAMVALDARWASLFGAGAA